MSETAKRGSKIFESYRGISISCLIVLCLVVVFLSACSSKEKKGKQTVCFRNDCINVAIAKTQKDRGRGLQLRKSLEKDEGMLFVFPSSQRQSFWMKNTYIPLDIIWMDRDKKIVFVVPNVLPCETEECPVYTPDTAASYVLEVNAGVSIELGWKVGDQAVF